MSDNKVSKTALFRIALDVLIGGLFAGVSTYSVTPNLKGSVLAATLAALKTLQSRIAPDLEKMTAQREAERA